AELVIEAGNIRLASAALDMAVADVSQSEEAYSAAAPKDRSHQATLSHIERRLEDLRTLARTGDVDQLLETIKDLSPSKELEDALEIRDQARKEAPKTLGPDEQFDASVDKYLETLNEVQKMTEGKLQTLENQKKELKRSLPSGKYILESNK